MIYKLKYLVAVSFFVLLSAQSALSQSIRSLNNSGVDLYKKDQFADAEVKFKKGLEKTKENFELNFNLGDSYYKQERYDEAVNAFQNSLVYTEDDLLKSKAFYNIGNSLLKSQKIKESVEAYKNSLKLNPNDKEAKYNLSYALSLLKQQQDQQQNQNQRDKNQDNQNQNDKNKNNQPNQNKDEQKDKEQKQQNKDQSSQQDNVKQQEKNNITKEEAERILEALKNNEKDLQKKLRKKIGVPVLTDKDW